MYESIVLCSCPKPFALAGRRGSAVLVVLGTCIKHGHSQCPRQIVLNQISHHVRHSSSRILEISIVNGFEGS
jgi:hypothetical protein